MPSAIRTTGSSDYKAIPDPVAGDDSLYHAVVALKEVVEVLTRQRKPLLAAAVTFQDLVDYGIIGADGRALQDNGRLMNELSSASDAGVLSGGALLVANNLSDVANAATALSNLNGQTYDAQLTSNIRQVSKSAAYTTVLTDGEKHILHPTADNNARTFTIDSNANVAYPLGTAITFVNQINTVTIAITSDTLTWLPSGSTGSRTLAANGMATALKIETTKWVISGVGLT